VTRNVSEAGDPASVTVQSVLSKVKEFFEGLHHGHACFACGGSSGQDGRLEERTAPIQVIARYVLS
jgi:hypothetical protein